MANTVVQPDSADVLSITDPVYAYKSDNGFFAAEFASNIGTADAVKFTTNGYSFAWKPDNVIYVDSAGNMDVVFGVNQQAVAQVWKSRVSFVGTTQITTDIFDCEPNQLKHTIQMVAPPRIPAGYVGMPTQMASGGVITYDKSLQVFANGEVQTSDFEVIGDIGFKDADGNLIYKLPMITVEDANGQTTQGTYKITFNADGTIGFYGMVPWDFLQSASYPVVIDPTVIVSSAYDTSGNGGRKIVRKANGQIYTIVYDSANYYDRIYKSTDGGQTWTQISTTTGGTSANASSGRCILTDANNNLYIFYTDNTEINYYLLDSNDAVITNRTSIYNTTNTIYPIYSPTSAMDNSGNIDLAWHCKNVQYPNVYNIMCIKGTVSGSTVSWSTPTQLTNDGGADHTNPCMAVKSNGNPILFWQYHWSSSSDYKILTSLWTGSAWSSTGTGSTVYDGGTYLQENPCGIVDGNGVIHLFWDGEDATYTAKTQIKYSKSTDGGSTWSAMTNLTTDANNASLNASASLDPSNNIYLFFDGYDPAISTSYTNIRELKCTGGTWGGVTTITNNTLSNAKDVQTLWSMFNMNSSDEIRYMFEDTYGNVQYAYVSLNNPPNAPTLTQHANFDATISTNFAWTFSDPNSGDTQSAYELQIVDVSSGSTVLDTGKVASTSSTYTLVANTLTNGKQYQWRVQTWDSSGTQGPYSTYSTFNTAAAPSVSVTAPTSGQSVTSSQLTVQWSYSDPASNAQQSYDVQLLDGTGANVLWDSGTQNDPQNSVRSYTLGYTLANNTSYEVRVTSTNSQGISATSAAVSFSVAFTPPAQATTTITPNANGYQEIDIANPAPTGSEPDVSSNDVYRRLSAVNGGSAGAWSRIATGVAKNGSFRDYAVGSGVQYDYKVTSYGSNGTQVDSAVVTATPLSLMGLWIHDVTNPSGTIINVPYYYNQSSDGTTPNTEQWTPTATSMQFAGRKLPVVQFGEQTDLQLTKGKITMFTSDARWPSVKALLMNRNVLCVRDARGRCVFGVAPGGYSETDLLFGQQVDLAITAVDYSIEV